MIIDEKVLKDLAEDLAERPTPEALLKHRPDEACLLCDPTFGMAGVRHRREVWENPFQTLIAHTLWLDGKDLVALRAEVKRLERIVYAFCQGISLSALRKDVMPCVTATDAEAPDLLKWIRPAK